jgi:hypothetical protein
MPDFSLCYGERDGETCPKRAYCRRFLAKPDPVMQSYMEPPPVMNSCTDFWPVDYTINERD